MRDVDSMGAGVSDWSKESLLFVQENLVFRGDCPRQKFATFFEKSKGRDFFQPESHYRTPFQRDRDRITHAGAFRRLAYKTQVFACYEGDHYRTRLSHSLEVTQAVRTMARVFRVDEDLAEAVALAHDLGHTPFGHAGEETLNECMQMYGGFDHNAQALRIVTKLEKSYLWFDGLNLSHEVLEGITKHNGPILEKNEKKNRIGTGGKKRLKKLKELPFAVLDYENHLDLDLDLYSGLESQLASVCDDIAYFRHDLEDGLRAKLFTVDDVQNSVPLMRVFFLQVQEEVKKFQTYNKNSKNYRNLGKGDLWCSIYEALRYFMGAMVDDVVAETSRRLQKKKPNSCVDVQNADEPLVSFSNGMNLELQILRQFLFECMYRHHKVMRAMHKAKKIIYDLFWSFTREPLLLSRYLQEQCGMAKDKQTARVVCDYIANMTDHSAINEYNSITASSAVSSEKLGFNFK